MPNFLFVTECFQQILKVLSFLDLFKFIKNSCYMSRQKKKICSVLLKSVVPRVQSNS